jgi:adenosine deaminase
MDIATFARRIPKTELHLHLEGSVRPETFAELAAKNGVKLPIKSDVRELYVYADLPAFLVIYDLVCASVRSADDFHRVTYEALSSCGASGARYVEFFFSPHAHLATTKYSVMLDGITRAMADAEKDKRVRSRLIPAHSRELGPQRGEEFLDMVLGDRRDEVIGIGLDYNEAPFPPAPYKQMYARAGAAGLRLAAHAGESGPAENVRDSLDILHVDRIDHGYRVVDDPALVARCLELGVPFTCCPSTSVVTSVWKDLAAPDHAIRRMIDAGLNVSIHSDDPPMFNTDLANEYVRVATEMKLTPAELKECALNGLRSTWLDEGTRREWAVAWSAEIDALTAQVVGQSGGRPV